MGFLRFQCKNYHANEVLAGSRVRNVLEMGIISGQNFGTLNHISGSVLGRGIEGMVVVLFWRIAGKEKRSCLRSIPAGEREQLNVKH